MEPPDQSRMRGSSQRSISIVSSFPIPACTLPVASSAWPQDRRYDVFANGSSINIPRIRRRVRRTITAGSRRPANCGRFSALETKRAISNDWVIRHNGRSLQLQPGQRRYGPTQSKALVCEWEDGTMRVYYRGERVAFTELKEPIRKTTRPMPAPIRPIVARKAKPDHPWRQGYQSMKPRVPNPGIATPLVGTRTYASP